MDSPKVVDLGISQMLSLVLEDDIDAELDVLSLSFRLLSVFELIFKSF